MDLQLLLSLLKGEKIAAIFPEIVGLVKDKASAGEIIEVSTSGNKYKPQHYLETYTSRYEYSKVNKNALYLGIERTLSILKEYEGDLVVGSIDDNGEHFTFFFSGNLGEVVALFKTVNMRLQH